MKAVHKKDEIEVYITEIAGPDDNTSHRLFCNARNPIAAAVITDTLNHALKTDLDEGGFWHSAIRRSVIDEVWGDLKVSRSASPE